MERLNGRWPGDVKYFLMQSRLRVGSGASQPFGNVHCLTGRTRRNSPGPDRVGHPTNTPQPRSSPDPRSRRLPTESTFRPTQRILGLAGLSLLALGLGSGLPAAESVERHVVPGTSVAIYDLAGQVTVEPASGGDVVVEVTRGGRDGARLRVEQGVIADWQTLRVVFPSDRVVYRQPGAWGTDLDVTDDGRFDDETLLHLKT